MKPELKFRCYRCDWVYEDPYRAQTCCDPEYAWHCGECDKSFDREDDATKCCGKEEDYQNE